MAHIIGAPTLTDALSALSRRIGQNEARGERTLVFCEDALTLLAERAVLCGRGATFLTEVTTFARYLAGGRVLSKQGSVAAVAAILSESAGELACFSPNAAQAVYESIAQLAASRVDAAMLRAGARETEGMLRAKLSDLALLLEKYAAFLNARGLLDESGYLALLPERLRTGGLGGTHVIFFGFSSFTRQAACGIRAAAACAASVTGIFPAGDRSYYTNESVRAFRAACEEEGEVTFSQLASTLTGDAERLRQGIFSPEAMLSPPVQAERVHIFRAQDEGEEARTVCALIKRHVLGGLRWRDIAVLTSGEGGIAAMERLFAAFRIPYFADVKRPFSRHPFCALVTAALRAVADGGLPASVDAVAANVMFGEGDVYRNYLAKYGGFRGAFRREIRADARGFEGDIPLLEDCRARMNAVLGCFPRSGTGRSFTQGVRALRGLVGADDACEALAARFTGAERDLLSLEALEGLLAETDAVTGERTLSAREFSALFTSAAEALKRATIPVLADAVFLGDATASRLARVKVLFVTGATDALPRTGEDTALITDGEMSRLAAQGVDIQPAIAVVNARSRESLALNVCAFTDALYVSRPLRVKGEEAAAGELFSSCAALFTPAPLPERFPYDCSERTPALERLFRERSSFEEGRGNDERLFSSVWAALAARGEEETLRSLTEGAGKNAVPEAAQLFLAGDVSPTLLEGYFSCPYAGFMKNGLRLKEREERAVLARDAGDFVHAVLDALAPRMNEVSDEEACRALALAVGEELLADARYAALGDTEAGTYARGRLLGESTAAALAAYRSLKGSSFRVRAGELAVRIPSLGLRGKADRVDEAGEYVRVVDYKTGNYDATPTAYYTGRSLQLELYLLAAAEGGRPAGAFYFPAEDRFSAPEEAKFRMQGFYNASAQARALFGEGGAFFDDAPSRGMEEGEFADFLGYAHLVAQRAREELRAGNIAPSPYEGSCDFCPFKGACGFAGAPRKEASVRCRQIAQIAAKERGE